MYKHPDQRVGIFIDTQNMYHSARHLFKRRVNFQNIFTDAIADRKIIRAIAYVIRTKTEEEQPFFEALTKIGIELQEKELIEFFSGAKKADWDVGLAIDVVRMVDMLDVIVLVTGDGDFCPLVEYVQSRGRIVELISFKETTNAKLLETVDASIDLSANKQRYMIGFSRSATNPKQKQRTTRREH
ncbi:hypothetical protein A2239_01160 [Candidatus Uhrbacteria bacterium RIFOXYA2_FULL_40_9]|nr:MAG: hypothetical protein A2239_01160 [Candidatus Uhrbacteria bacterium RIFOXYA2_FULL_40_9]OGL98282.1 MAG: hypothetical protein A2332_04995 [Candidatus Uhrbacteria bacterium RIFOXYB2_FULL_41_18]HCB55694.1 hypothetical protein [Candidatus Uhrbacteria bacterium]